MLFCERKSFYLLLVFNMFVHRKHIIIIVRTDYDSSASHCVEQLDVPVLHSACVGDRNDIHMAQVAVRLVESLSVLVLHTADYRQLAFRVNIGYCAVHNRRNKSCRAAINA